MWRDRGGWFDRFQKIFHGSAGKLSDLWLESSKRWLGCSAFYGL